MHRKLPQGVAWCKEDYDKRGPINQLDFKGSAHNEVTGAGVEGR